VPPANATTRTVSVTVSTSAFTDATVILQYHPEIRNATLASAQLNLTLRPIDAPELRQLTTGTCVVPTGLTVQSAFHLSGALTADNPVLGAVDYSTNSSYFDGLRVHICIDGAWSDVDAVATADGRSDLTTVQTGARVSFAGTPHPGGGLRARGRCAPLQPGLVRA
jgi:hypothetical protein